MPRGSCLGLDGLKATTSPRQNFSELKEKKMKHKLL